MSSVDEELGQTWGHFAHYRHGRPLCSNRVKVSSQHRMGHAGTCGPLRFADVDRATHARAQPRRSCNYSILDRSPTMTVPTHLDLDRCAGVLAGSRRRRRPRRRLRVRYAASGRSTDDRGGLGGLGGGGVDRRHSDGALHRGRGGDGTARPGSRSGSVPRLVPVGAG